MAVRSLAVTTLAAFVAASTLGCTIAGLGFGEAIDRAQYVDVQRPVAADSLEFGRVIDARCVDGIRYSGKLESVLFEGGEEYIVLCREQRRSLIITVDAGCDTIPWSSVTSLQYEGELGTATGIGGLVGFAIDISILKWMAGSIPELR